MGASPNRLFTPDSNPSPSQTEYEVERGRIEAANSEALNSPALKSREAYRPMGLKPSAASAAVLMSRDPCDQMAPAQATTMKNAITVITTQPTSTSMRDSVYSLASMPFSTTADCR